MCFTCQDLLKEPALFYRGGKQCDIFYLHIINLKNRSYFYRKRGGLLMLESIATVEIFYPTKWVFESKTLSEALAARAGLQEELQTHFWEGDVNCKLRNCRGSGYHTWSRPNSGQGKAFRSPDLWHRSQTVKQERSADSCMYLEIQ